MRIFATFFHIFTLSVSGFKRECGTGELKMKLIPVLALSCLLVGSVAYAENFPDNPRGTHINDPAVPVWVEDGPSRGYLAWESHSMANFGDDSRSYSSAGVSLILMFHGKKRLRITIDAGLEWSNFSFGNRGRDFALNNFNLQAVLPIKFFYLKGGY